MVEWEQWNFPEPSFDRGYFNDRLKLAAPVNILTHQRMNRLFETVFYPGNRTGRFQEPQAIEAANALILLISEFFGIDLSIWKNSYTAGNSVSRSHLLCWLFYVYGCSPEEQILLIQTSTIPNIHFAFEQAKKWFGLKNRTLLNRLEKRGWLKKEAVYDNGRNRYRYFMHSVIASAVRAQFLDELYHTCQGFIREITAEMKDSLTQSDAVKKS